MFDWALNTPLKLVFSFFSANKYLFKLSEKITYGVFVVDFKLIFANSFQSAFFFTLHYPIEDTVRFQYGCNAVNSITKCQLQNFKSKSQLTIFPSSSKRSCELSATDFKQPSDNSKVSRFAVGKSHTSHRITSNIKS